MDRIAQVCASFGAFPTPRGPSFGFTPTGLHCPLSFVYEGWGAEPTSMPRGDKSSYTSKQKRQAEHIEESEKERGRSTRTAERIAWATVNKQDGGGRKRGGGRSRS